MCWGRLQRPEVRLHITQGKATHVLEACLTAEGARSYKVDGKNRTGTQVKVSSTASALQIPANLTMLATGLGSVSCKQVFAQPHLLFTQQSTHIYYKPAARKASAAVWQPCHHTMCVITSHIPCAGLSQGTRHSDRPHHSHTTSSSHPTQRQEQ